MASAEPYMGTMVPFGSNFAIRGWGVCAGGLLSISQYSALFSLLGTMYGGDGRTTVGLPDMRGRNAVGYGTGPGMHTLILGQRGGIEMLEIPLPQHDHTAYFSASGTSPVSVTLSATTTEAGSTTPSEGAYLAAVQSPGGLDKPELIYSTTPGATVELGGISVIGGGAAGGTVTVGSAGTPNTTVYNRSPFQAVNWLIAMTGIYPPRN